MQESRTARYNTAMDILTSLVKKHQDLVTVAYTLSEIHGYALGLEDSLDRLLVAEAKRTKKKLTPKTP